MKKSSKISQKKPLLRAVLILCLSLFVFGLVMTIHQAAGADDEISLLEVYREKKFKGALDEEELKVLSDLQSSASSKKKSQEATEGF